MSNTHSPLNIGIYSSGSISALGNEFLDVLNSYKSGQGLFKLLRFEGLEALCSPLQLKSQKLLESFLEERGYLSQFDRVVHLGAFAAESALYNAGWINSAEPVGLVVGSARGAGGALEHHHQAFLSQPEGKLLPTASPTTTAGSLTSAPAQILKLKGPAISHSVTCSSGFHAILTAAAWIKAGFCSRMLAGGSEAPLTPFILAQMRALRLFSRRSESEFPCRPFLARSDRENTLVLGEGAAIFALGLPERETTEPLAVIEGLGWSLEGASTLTSISEQGAGLQDSMRQAIEMCGSESIDLVIAHAPGSFQGDKAEFAALQDVFGEDLPIIHSNKWFIGHTFGASGPLSLEYALLLLNGDLTPAPFPYPVPFINKERPIRRILINTTGFGGNAVSMVVGKP